MRNLMLGLLTAILVFAGLAGAGFAAAPFLVPAPPNVYRTAFFDITLPKGWSCALDGTETVCQSSDPPPHNAIIIAAMKYRNAQRDTLAAYRQHLETPQSQTLEDGTVMTSRIDHLGAITLEGRSWVDATHFESEIANYETRYLATVTVQLGILITFSAHRSSFEAYQPVFEKAVRSLNVYQRYDGAAENPPA